MKQIYEIKTIETMEIGMQLRSLVIEKSIIIESFISILLSDLLNIEDYQNTKSFGNKSSSLSFNQKTVLFLDLGLISKENVTKFNVFMEIRNQFSHNIYANTMENCLKSLDGKINFLEKTYPSDEEILEIKYIDCVDKLLNDLLTVVKDLIENIKKSSMEKIEFKMYKNSNDAFTYAIFKVESNLPYYFEKHKFTNDQIKDLNQLSKYIFEQISFNYANKFTKLNDENVIGTAKTNFDTLQDYFKLKD